jgi:hypothetical protein
MNFIELKKVVKKEIGKYLPPPLTQLTMEYFLKTVALCWRDTTGDRDHISADVCYKAMDLVEWENLVRDIIKKKKFDDSVKLDYDGEAETKVSEILKHTTVITTEPLLTALEYISPHYLGNDIDVFEGLSTGGSTHGWSKNNDEYDDNWEPTIAENIWNKGENQPHIKLVRNAKYFTK